MDIARYITSARQRMRMSQKEFANVLSVSQGSVSKWESGKESPRAEVVEKIRELSGHHPPEDQRNETSEEDDAFSTFCEVPLRGVVHDGRPYAPYSADAPRSLRLYVSSSLATANLEAWVIRGRYDDMPRIFIGVFELLPPAEFVSGAHGRGETILTRTVYDKGTTSLALEEIYENGRQGTWLWPLDRHARTRTLPVVLNDEGISAKGSTQPIGVLRHMLTGTPKRGSLIKF